MNGNLRRQIREKCSSLDIPLTGFAPADRWDDSRYSLQVPEPYRPRSIFPETNSAIVIGLSVSLPILETAPSIWYRELYRTVNTLLDEAGYRISTALTAEGYPSVWIPRDGYGSISVLKEQPVAFFSHRHAAYYAGLGNFGTSNMLLTPEFGPRVRFATILTAAEIPPDPVMEEPLCTRCMACEDACPVNALGTGDYPASLTDKNACATRSEILAGRYAAPCGICIRVCPVGKDRTRLGHTDPELYDENSARFGQYHRAWRHVRSHGSR